MRLFLYLALLCSIAFADWQMFADNKDTYIYNTNTGEVFIKTDRDGGYKDIFVRMPRGVLPEELESDPQEMLPLTPNKDQKEKMRDEALDIQKNFLQNVIQ